MIDDLAPRKGHFSSSPWQRHGKTVPQKEYALKGHPDLPGPFQFGRNHEAPLQGLLFLLRTIPMALPWAASCLLRGGKTPIITDSWYQPQDAGVTHPLHLRQSAFSASSASGRLRR